MTIAFPGVVANLSNALLNSSTIVVSETLACFLPISGMPQIITLVPLTFSAMLSILSRRVPGKDIGVAETCWSHVSSNTVANYGICHVS